MFDRQNVELERDEATQLAVVDLATREASKLRYMFGEGEQRVKDEVETSVTQAKKKYETEVKQLEKQHQELLAEATQKHQEHVTLLYSEHVKYKKRMAGYISFLESLAKSAGRANLADLNDEEAIKAKNEIAAHSELIHQIAAVPRDMYGRVKDGNETGGILPSKRKAVDLSGGFDTAGIELHRDRASEVVKSFTSKKRTQWEHRLINAQSTSSSSSTAPSTVNAHAGSILHATARIHVTSDEIAEICRQNDERQAEKAEAGKKVAERKFKKQMSVPDRLADAWDSIKGGVDLNPNATENDHAIAALQVPVGSWRDWLKTVKEYSKTNGHNALYLEASEVSKHRNTALRLAAAAFARQSYEKLGEVYIRSNVGTERNQKT